MSLTEKEVIPDKYGWSKTNPHDPTDVREGFSFDGKEGICGICLVKITQPIIEGIWYHRDSWDVVTKNHIPIPASIIVQLFHYNLRPKKAYENFEKSKKCKHSKWWNDCLDWKPCHEGIYSGHYRMSNYVTLCGRVTPLRDRNWTPRDEIYFPSGVQMDECKKCYEKIEKLGMIKRVKRKGIKEYSYNRFSYQIVWLKKKLTKKFIEEEKTKYTKVLK